MSKVTETSPVNLEVSLGERSYPIVIADGALTGSRIRDIARDYSQVFVLTNDTVASYYLEPLLENLNHQNVFHHVIPDGEKYKSAETLFAILDKLVDARIERGAVLIALGGGVIGDIGGFAASIYQRGIDFIQVPTTLLAQVDSSVGGKTAINHPRAKNMIGAFHQPVCVIADTSTLRTLPTRELRAGIAEVIKYGLINDAEFFAWLEEHADKLVGSDQAALAFAIHRSCQNKANIVARDERESSVRALLNLGHTFGHAIENLLGYGVWLHGEAIATGMVIAADLSAATRSFPQEELARVLALFEFFDLPTKLPRELSAESVWTAMCSDKKTVDGKPNLILLDKIGQAAVVNDYSLPEVMAAIERASVSTSAADMVSSP